MISRLPAPFSVRAPAFMLVSGLVGSALLLAFAPLLMPESYHWITHTTSESAAQGIESAWLARLGFFLFGISVLALAGFARSIWNRWATLFHCLFGVFMLAVGAFSIRSWEANAAFDRTEDLLHSIGATGVGFAFAFGVLLVMVFQDSRLRGRRMIDLVALASSIVLPLGMTLLPDYAGLLQRAMFLVGYLWYGLEAFSLTGGCIGRRRPRG